MSDIVKKYGKVFHRIPDTNHYVSRDGVVMNSNGAYLKEKPTRQYTIGRVNRGIYSILLDTFYPEIDKKRSIVVTDPNAPKDLKKTKFYDLDEYSKKMDTKYDIINDGRYILFDNGQCYSTKFNKFISLITKGQYYYYRIENINTSLTKLLITSFGTNEMKKDYSRYILVGGIGIKNIVLKDEAELKPAIILGDLKTNKFKCKRCGLMFKANNTEEIIASKKKCVLCLSVNADKKYKHQNNDIDKLITCKRCGAGYRKKVDSCLKCSCLEFK